MCTVTGGKGTNGSFNLLSLHELLCSEDTGNFISYYQYDIKSEDLLIFSRREKKMIKKATKSSCNFVPQVNIKCLEISNKNLMN